jgi:AcrR family transcriptional regulator
LARTIAKDYDDKRRLILDRAAQLFADESYDRASMNNVAKACGISKANIYHYYSSKDDILFDILDLHLSTLRDRICLMDMAGLDVEQRFRKAVVEILLAYQGADNEHRLQATALNHLPPDKQKILVSYQRDLVAYLSNLIADVAPDIFAGDKKKLQAATMSIFGMLNWFYMWNHGATKDARQEYADTVCTLSLRGLSGL